MLLLLLAACSRQPAAAPLPAHASPSPTLTASIPPVTPAMAASPTTAMPSTPLPEVTFEKGPYLVPGSEVSSINVLWQAPDATNYRLEYHLAGNNPPETVIPVGPSGDGLVQATLTNLLPGSQYDYCITDGMRQVSGSFNTAPAGLTALTFWVYGDSRSGAEIQNAIASQVLASIQSDASAQSFVLFSGDIMDLASEDSLQSNQFDPQYASIRRMMSFMPMINAMGNHDGTQLFTKYFPYPFKGHYYWSFDYGPVHVAVVDQYADVSPTSVQWTWLKEDLAAAQQPWKFILLHEPGWSAGPHPNNDVVQKIIQPIAYHQGVAVIFAGHNHYYARAEVDGVVHITTGGGGAPLYDPLPGSANVRYAQKSYHYLKVEVNGNALHVTVLTPENVEIDSFTITH